MTLPLQPNQISASLINVELGNSSSSQLSLNATIVRNLLGKASGQIAYSDAWGKSAAPSIIFPTDNASDVSKTLTITASAFNMTGAHLNTDWEIYDNNSNTIVESNYASTTDLTSWSPSLLMSGSTYQVRVRYRNNDPTPLVTQWSTRVRFSILSACNNLSTLFVTGGSADSWKQQTQWTGFTRLSTGYLMISGSTFPAPTFLMQSLSTPSTALARTSVPLTVSNGPFVATASNPNSQNAVVLHSGGAYYTLNSGGSWIASTLPSGLNYSIPNQRIFWTGSMYVITAFRLGGPPFYINDQVILTSTNGATFTEVNSNAPGEITYLGTTYYRKNSSAIYSSSDLVTWTLVTSDAPSAPLRVWKLGSTFILVGSGVTYTSTDLITWQTNSVNGISEPTNGFGTIGNVVNNKFYLGVWATSNGVNWDFCGNLSQGIPHQPNIVVPAGSIIAIREGDGFWFGTVNI